MAVAPSLFAGTAYWLASSSHASFSWLSPDPRAEGYRGNRYEPVSLPLGNNGQFNFILEQYRFTRGEPILVAASIQGPQVVADRLELSLKNSLNRYSVVSARLITTDGDGIYEVTIAGSLVAVLGLRRPLHRGAWIQRHRHVDFGLLNTQQLTF
ncbi:hypothetical protein [Marinobacter sediminum]|uniref:hypothetical protein n=1 Tax=Marinobacter sediminum TaxID=256323 RepID=UPI00193A3CCF|nr:hypothetical protein [Marinobacter sediminum]